jgi:hypothetical protein
MSILTKPQGLVENRLLAAFTRSSTDGVRRRRQANLSNSKEALLPTMLGSSAASL